MFADHVIGTVPETAPWQADWEWLQEQEFQSNPGGAGPECAGDMTSPPAKTAGWKFLGHKVLLHATGLISRRVLFQCRLLIEADKLGILYRIAGCDKDAP